MGPSNQHNLPNQIHAADWFISVRVKVTESKAVMVYEDGNGHEYARQEIPYTDFPMADFILYCCWDGEHWVRGAALRNKLPLLVALVTLPPTLTWVPHTDQVLVDQGNDSPSHSMLLKQVPKVQNSSFIRNRAAAQRKICKSAHGSNLIERLFHRWVAQSEPLRHAVHPDRRRQRVSRSRAVMIYEDGNDKEHARQEIPYTDFPLDSITLYACWDQENWVIMLPSEY